MLFSTGASPASAASALYLRLRVIEGDDRLQSQLHENTARLRMGLGQLGLPLLGYGPIVPIVLGAPPRALRAASFLRARGVHVQAVRPPTVPTGSSRLRITVTAAHSAEDIDGALGAFEQGRSWLVRSY